MGKSATTAEKIHNDAIVGRVQSSTTLQQLNRFRVVKVLLAIEKFSKFLCCPLRVVYFGIFPNSHWRNSCFAQFAKKPFHTWNTITIWAKPYSIILESLEKSFFRETPAASSWRLYYTPGGRRNLINICFNRWTY